jgi:hypothetical protein
MVTAAIESCSFLRQPGEISPIPRLSGLRPLFLSPLPLGVAPVVSVHCSRFFGDFITGNRDWSHGQKRPRQDGNFLRVIARQQTPSPISVGHPDLVVQQFNAAAPAQSSVTVLTFVPTWAWVALKVFIIEGFSGQIFGWWVAPHMRTEIVLDANEMAR